MMTEARFLKCDLCLWTAITSRAEWVGLSPAGNEYVLCDLHAKDTKIRIKNLRPLSPAAAQWRLEHPAVKNTRREQ